MTDPLVRTKLYGPKRRSDAITRSRLSERLRRGIESRLTLISAPAAFGKTTLLAGWLADDPGATVAWLSLEETDSRPVRFWSYVAAALQMVVPGLGASALLLKSTDPPIENFLAVLVNELSEGPPDVVLVLDDYHLIDSPGIAEGVTFLLEHLPAQVHLVISTRADPRLPLARWRARGELTEIRAADLRFTRQEARTYFDAVSGLDLSAANVAVLDERTEGWIAALQLAAISMRGRADVGGFIAGFAGNDRYIVDYLVEEVLQRQPDRIRTFLLSTSVLDRLSGPLCDSVTAQPGSTVTLEELDDANLFLIPLDDVRQWYRYHHLFADVLRARLIDSRPDDIALLHGRASEWYEHNGEPFEAIRHALAAEDFHRAADLVELAIPGMRRTRQEAVVHDWLNALPKDVIRVRPVLSVGLAGALLAIGELDGVEPHLQQAERWLASSTLIGPDTPARPDEMVVVDEREFGHLSAAIALYRAAPALARGDVPTAVTQAQRALDLSPEDDHLPRAAAAGLLAIAHWNGGDLAAADHDWGVCAAGLHQAGHVADTFGCAIARADIQRTRGRLDEAMRTYQAALQLADDGSVRRGTADMHVGMSEVHRERDDLSAAMHHLLLSQKLGEHLGLPQNPYRWRVALAAVRQAEGDLSGALGLLDDAERRYVGDYFPNVRPVPAIRARLRLARGEVGEALGWVHERGLSSRDDLSYTSEFEHITLARVMLAQLPPGTHRGAAPEATGLLQRLLVAAEDGGRAGTAIEILVLLALADWTRGDLPSAFASLDRAITLAEPQGYVRVFVDEGPPMASLLRAADKARIARPYVRRLLPAAGEADPGPLTDQGLIDPLSGRELEVLRLLYTDRPGPDIARTLSVSLNTVRTHTKSIYTKLGVNHRRAAVRRAQELGLLPGHPSSGR